MNSFNKLIVVFGLALLAVSCADKSKPNYQYMPNMYESVGYEAYGEADFLPYGMEAKMPVENTISRGWIPYGIENTPEGKEIARINPSPLDSLQSVSNLSKGKELYGIYCAICHGPKGKGQGTLVKREKILGVPSYADAARNITVGTAFHTVQYGLNSMGSYASQMNTEEMWQVSEYVMALKQDLIK
ncbi:quinol:cytochrome c oxidoreductase monoheme cytochrome subunit [Maribacter vaceletii]|uniref:Quinol:cytochrome c oxidoreductase monoheme cytochrome subunit n=1 Tax=Maribacter vaceletii TaxID=1206816 RepID=A0A495EC52_9FLAO|nr:cytochrome c [Maribacter vaceletii]RKR14133.1 quinol:cytochrome c oxidoreductase monoheme cytochrome subunit [Maribacter vaceletii]